MNKKPETPTNDKRWRLVDAAMRRHGNKANGLIETLHTVQESFGCLDEAGLRYVGQCLKVPLSKVYGVATFYHLFTLKPQGTHTCVVCMGTACYIKGTAGILDRIQREFKVKPGETTEDNELSLLTARCVGSCGLAPAVVYDGEVKGKQTDDQTVTHIRNLLSTRTQEGNAS